MHSAKFSPWQRKDEQRHGESRMMPLNGGAFHCKLPRSLLSGQGWQMSLQAAMADDDRHGSVEGEEIEEAFYNYGQGLGECFREDVNHQR
jgi:hypothetical protein